MALERTYIIPLRKEWLKSPKYKRAKKAVSAVRNFLIKHMKSEDVRIGNYLNLEIWKDGIKSPPGKIRVNVVKDDEGIVRAELFGAPMPKPVEKKTGKEEPAEKKVPKPAKSAEKKETEPVSAEKKEKKVKPTEPSEEKPEKSAVEVS